MSLTDRQVSDAIAGALLQQLPRPAHEPLSALSQRVRPEPTPEAVIDLRGPWPVIDLRDPGAVAAPAASSSPAAALAALSRRERTDAPTDAAPATASPVGSWSRRRPRLVEIPRAHAEQSMAYGLDWVERCQPGMSARTRTTRGQRLFMAALLSAVVVCLVVWPLGTAVALATGCVLLYAATITHRVLAFRSSLRHDPFVRVSDDEARSFPDEELPTYTVLVPAFREPEVIPELIRSLERLEYPRDRLEVKLLLEEGDQATLDAALAVVTDVPVEILVAPAGEPQTKPRALNYGLLWSTGELVTIYDAEDRPEPLQLRRAAVALRSLPPDWACLQARLDFYDSNRNLLTKWFTADYLTWFNCFLPGMVVQRGVVPLGGTSNHFRRSALVATGAWDPYNVTEDADLGLRLQCSGYRVGVLDSVTYEEANSDVINWVKQRSRWQKGYLQTALVHLRRPRRFIDQMGWRGLVHLILFVAGTPLLGVLNLLFWSLTLTWVVTSAGWIEAVFPGAVFYLSTAVWLLGNLTIAYLGLVTLLEVRRPDLLWSTLLAPLYWVLMSLAALRALLQLIVDPFHWEKTTHGLSAAAHEGAVPGEAGVELPQSVGLA